MKIPVAATVTLLLITLGLFANAQTAEEIISNYFEHTGGIENWESIKTLTFDGKINIQGAEYPIEMIQTAQGLSMTKIRFQGQTIYQNVYDGEILWSTDEETMKAIKSDAEATENFKKQLHDFPDPFLNYKDKGYSVELLGKEMIEGTETYKIKLVKGPVIVDGKEGPDVSFYYFDIESFVPILMEKEIKSGPAAGMVSQLMLSDYQETGGLYFPFSMVKGIKGRPGVQAISIINVTINAPIDPSIFAYPQ